MGEAKNDKLILGEKLYLDLLEMRTRAEMNAPHGAGNSIRLLSNALGLLSSRVESLERILKVASDEIIKKLPEKKED